MRALIVDDEAGVRSVISRVVGRAGGSCEMAGTAEEALERLAHDHFDVALLDIHLPGMDGLSLAREIGRQYPDVALIMITGSVNFQAAVEAMQAGAVDYVLKPFGTEALTGAFERAVEQRRIRLQASRAQQLHQTITERTVELGVLLAQPGDSAESLIKGFVAALRFRDEEAANHAQRVVELCRRIGAEMQLPAPELDLVVRAAAVHDIGKLTLPAALLTSKERLKDDEVQIMRRHPEFGQEVLSRVPVLADCAPVVLAQLERHNGSGGPIGLRGDQIPLAARIIAVANVYDVMTHPRPHATQRSPVQALDEIDSCSGTQFDPRVASALFAVMNYEPVREEWDPDADI